jgi:hypothetical protein
MEPLLEKVTLRRPIRYEQTIHALKLAGIVRHECESEGFCVSRNQRVAVAYWRSGAFQLDSHSSVLGGCNWVCSGAEAVVQWCGGNLFRVSLG